MVDKFWPLRANLPRKILEEMKYYLTIVLKFMTEKKIQWYVQRHFSKDAKVVKGKLTNFLGTKFTQ